MKKLLFYLLLSLFAFAFLYPFLWMVSASLSEERSITNVTLWPVAFTLDHYIKLFQSIPISGAFLNSIFVATLVTFGVLVFSSMAGYALARHRFKGRNLLFYFLLFTMTLPFQLTLIPNYILMVQFGWTNSFAALIIPGLLNAFAILLFRQHFLSIPQDLIDAARIDGCNELRILFQVLWPVSVPTLITVGIITFMTTWNDVLWPIIVIREEKLMTMPQLVTLFAVGGRSMGQIGMKLASATLLAMPIIIAYLIFQKHFIQSMAASGQKE
ncbi:MAG: carbohydrate ABC transporter permease [Saprospiraceae bacterium]|jgi:multiple sugar transport system permease protein|nr:carbohydrate ABC transporter permease [Candidatus Opimibacter skivensis]